MNVFQLLIEFLPEAEVLSVSNPVVPFGWPPLRSLPPPGRQAAGALSLPSWEAPPEGG